MRGLNQVTIMGNIARDVEVKQTSNGTPFVNLSLACNYAKKVGGLWEDAVDFIPVTCWDKTAETIGKYLSKGDPLLVTGKIQTRSWETSEGEKRYKTEVVGHRIYFVGGKKKDNGVPEEQREHFDEKRNGYAPQEPRQETWLGDEEADIPF